MKIAVIDLGTNTFHLLIVEITDNGFEEVHRNRQFIHLAENGITTIGDAPYSRALKTMNQFGLDIIHYGAQKVVAKGTAALRRASNGAQFMQEVKAQTGITIETISGDEEAKLIYYGVRQAVKMTDEKMLIMDIGGGSVEFIIANKDQKFWAQSFPIGVAVLFQRFHHQEPIAKSDLKALQGFLQTTLEPLKNALKEYPADTLVGASGTFDVLEKVMTINHQTKNSADIEISEFQPLHQRLIVANLEERLKMEDISNQRAKLIVVAVALLDFVLNHFQVKHIKVSNFAMKEGMIHEGRMALID
jgi:exopolyphosphatase/guanosine-5'-triphosphate,3'-diphosphate pyrophosphatase